MACFEARKKFKQNPKFHCYTQEPGADRKRTGWFQEEINRYRVQLCRIPVSDIPYILHIKDELEKNYIIKLFKRFIMN